MRVFHWLLVIAVLLSYLSAEYGEDIGDWALSHGIFFDAIVWHSRCGYFILSLLLFRLVWGVIGSSTARFAQFIVGPGKVFNYVRQMVGKNKMAYPGHNPLGGYAVLAMLLLLLSQTLSGLFADDEIAFTGPLAHLVSSKTSEALTDWHRLNFDLLLIMMGLHLVAIFTYQWLFHESLAKGMFTGTKIPTSPSHANVLRSAWLGLMVYAGAALLVAWVVS